MKIWRCSFDDPPPPMEPDHPFYSNISKDRRSIDLTKDHLPSCNSMKDIFTKALPFWNEEIVLQIEEGKRVMTAVHNNSLRGIVTHLEGFSEEAITNLNLPTGIPNVYELDKDLNPIMPMQFLRDEETVHKAGSHGCLGQGQKVKASRQTIIPRSSLSLCPSHPSSPSHPSARSPAQVTLITSEGI